MTVKKYTKDGITFKSKSDLEMYILNISNTDEIKIEENKPTITLKEKIKPNKGLIILILLVSLTQQPYWQPFISNVAILFGLFFLLIYIKNKRKNNSKHQPSTIIDFLIPSKGAIIFVALFIVFSVFFLIKNGMTNIW